MFYHWCTNSSLSNNIILAWLICTSLWYLLDLKKAFDCVSHLGVLHKLNSINLDDNLGCWFHSYLLGRTQSVRVGTVTSVGPSASTLLSTLGIDSQPNIVHTIHQRHSSYLPKFLLQFSQIIFYFINQQLHDIYQWITNKPLMINTCTCWGQC